MKKIILIFSAILLFAACKKDKDPTDPRMAFVGQYQSREYTFHFHRVDDGIPGGDTTITVDPGSDMPVCLSQGSTGGVEMDMTALVDDAATALYARFSVPFSIHFEKDVLAQVDGRDFTFDSTAFEHTHLGSTMPGSISGHGTLSGNVLSLEYEVELIMQESPTLIIFGLYGELKFTKQ